MRRRRERSQRGGAGGRRKGRGGADGRRRGRGGADVRDRDPGIGAPGEDQHLAVFLSFQEL